jgi:transcriptional regulator with XRE-family HTH domain
MNLASRRQPPTVRLRRLAAELRGLRAAVGMTREDVSEHTGINAATLYRIETAKVRPQRRTLIALLDRYRVTDESKRTDLIALSQQATQLGWLQAFESQLPEEYTTYISFEAEARSIRNYETLFVPGLLQTEQYAKAVIAGVLPLAPAEDADRRVQARLKRQALLSKKHPLNLWAIIDEAVLHRRVGGAEVITAQLNHLAETAKLPHVTLQVLPFGVGAHPGMTGSFAVMDFPDPADPELVYIETMGGDLFLERESDVRRYTTIFEHLRAAALNPTDSIRLITTTATAVHP